MAKSRRTSHRPARPAATKAGTKPSPGSPSTGAPVAVAATPTQPKDKARQPTQRPATGRPAAAPSPAPRVSPAVVTGAALTALWLLLGVTGVLSTFGLALFLIALSWAGVALAEACGVLWDPTDALQSARRVVALVVVVALPVTFDPGTAERFNVSKLTVLVIGALVLAALWIVDALTNVKVPDLRTGLHWPIAAMVLVGALATIFSVSPKLSFLGAYQSYDGFLALASFAVVALVAAEAWRPSDLRPILTTFLLAAGGPVVLYGLIQIADVELSTNWDWIGFINVNASFGPTSTVWSTFGNPNHLAGFVACLLPIGLVTVLSDRSVLTRVLAAAVMAGALLCLVETSSLGGLGAAVIAVVLTSLLLIPEFRAHRRAAMWLGAGVAVAAVVAIVIVAAQGTFERKLDAVTDWSSGTSTAAQRVEFWQSAVDMASERPFFGWGPDTFAYLSPTFQTQGFVDAFGPDQVINGAHNMFLQTLATKGVFGLAALLFFVVWIGLRAWGGWRHVRARERAHVDGAWREQRLMLTAAVGAATAVIAQSSFNVEMLGINIALWAMAATVSVVALGAGVPASLDPRAILRVGDVDAPGVADGARRPHRRPARRASIAVPVIIASIAVLVLSWFASTWWRAERSYQIAVEDSAVLASGEATAIEQERALGSTLGAFRDAKSQNTVESRYPLTEAQFQLGVLAAANLLSADNVGALGEVRGLLEEAIDRGPRDPVSLASYGRLLARLRELVPETGEPELEADLFERAARANPFNPAYVTGQVSALIGAGDIETARETVEEGLARFPENPTLLAYGVSTSEALGDESAARAFQARIDALPQP